MNLPDNQAGLVPTDAPATREAKSDATTFTVSCPDIEKELWVLYRDFFDMAEKKRRWNVREDIPWGEVNKQLDPVIADVLETFCAVELYLPDYTGKILPMVRKSKGRVWFYANWGYEESKHSMVLNDWLQMSASRTDEQMTDLENKVWEREWNLPMESSLGMLAYAMVQELATFLNYRNLKSRVTERGGDPALQSILTFLQVDEKAHYTFFRDCFKVFLKHDREQSLAELRRVIQTFQMPAIHDLLDESNLRIKRIRELEIFSEEIFFRDVYEVVLRDLELSRRDLRGDRKPKKSTPGVSS